MVPKTVSVQEEKKQNKKHTSLEEVADGDAMDKRKDIDGYICV